MEELASYMYVLLVIVVKESGVLPGLERRI